MTKLCLHSYSRAAMLHQMRDCEAIQDLMQPPASCILRVSVNSVVNVFV